MQKKDDDSKGAEPQEAEPVDRFAEARRLLEAVLIDKAEGRRRSAQLPWHEKVKIAERVRDACRLARESMARSRSTGKREAP